MNPNKRKVKPTLFSIRHTKKFKKNNEYTHIFYTRQKMRRGIRAIDYSEINYNYLMYKKAIKYVDTKINAVDIGCRDGEVTRYLTWSFDHVYCFDYRRRKQFAMNIDVNQVTHYSYPLGKELHAEAPSGRGNFRNPVLDDLYADKPPINVYPLDYFKLKDVNLIKIDVDGMDKEVVQGAVETINKYKPVIIIEEVIMDGGIINHTGVEYIKSLGYKTAEIHQDQTVPQHKDYILIPSN